VVVVSFFDQKRAPAVVKHGLLRRYCPAFANKAGSQTGKRVTFLDGYAGAGCYEDDTPGSPLVMLNAARKLAGKIDIDAVFIEKDPATYARLEKVLASRCHGQPYRPLSGDVEQHIESVMLSCHDRALFAFFDPFGPALSRTRLCSLLSQRRRSRMPTDVLLHVSVRSVWNFGSRLTKARREERELSSQDQALAASLDRFLGAGWWRAEFEKVGTDPGEAPDGELLGRRPAAIALEVAQQYGRSVAEETGYYTVSMPVRRQPAHVPIFVLTLFTRHPDGAWLFADCIGQAGLDWEEAWRTAQMAKKGSTSQLEMFSLEEYTAFDRDKYERDNNDQWTSIIEQNIDGLLNDHRPLRLQHHVADVFGTTLGTGARSKHARAAVKKLHRAGKVDHNGTGRYFYRDPMVRPGRHDRASMRAG
jgi:three-Cys-motif partner protein